MLLWLPLLLFDSMAVTVTIAFPEAGIVTVTAGPTVVRFVYVRLVVVSEVAIVAPRTPEIPVAPFAPVVPFEPVAPLEPAGP
jgi:hypothetical protein